MTVLSPVTGESVATVVDMTAQIPQLVARAREAQRDWARRSLAERVKTLGGIRRWLIDNREAIISSTMRETGKTRQDAFGFEVLATADLIKFWEGNARRYLRDEHVPAGSIFAMGRSFTVAHDPLGVVGVIAPWNYPLNLGLGDAIPALVAGNAVVIKPSEITPITTALVVDGLVTDRVVPEYVLQVATGGGETGAALVDAVDMIQFTGSTRTGRKVGLRAAQRLIPYALEMGGKDPMIVCADANLDRAAHAAATWGLANSGQVCMSVERIYVEAPGYDEFVEKLVGLVQPLRVGVDVGAITFAGQLDIIERQVADALAKGARALTGGRRAEGEARYFEPTVLVDVTHEMECMREETFGPVLPVMKVADVEEAVRLANDSAFGLTSYVFTKDTGKGEWIARRLASGSAVVNDGFVHIAARHAPMGGVKGSGAGAPRNGRDGILKFTASQTVMSSRTGFLAAELGWIGFSERLTGLAYSALTKLYGR